MSNMLCKLESVPSNTRLFCMLQMVLCRHIDKQQLMLGSLAFRMIVSDHPEQIGRPRQLLRTMPCVVLLVTRHMVVGYWALHYP